ncbi:MAG: hypothetical protein E7Z90_03015 [Cyanobacteria bacterium SIG29]|nr:hypothetical protein [Cyanobacteria bacterium SIG29]
MKKLFSLLITVLVLFTMSATTSYSAITLNKKMNANIKTKRVPEGTTIKLKVLNPVSSANGNVGDRLDLMVVDNIKVDGSVVIPKGSVVRGTLEEVSASKMLYKGGMVRLDFDHIVSSTGKQVPFTAGICNNPNVTYDGALSTKTNYMTALTKTIEKSKDIIVTPVTWAWDKGSELWNGSPKYVFAPLTAIVSAPAGGIYFIGDAVYDCFKKGENISISQGETIQVQLLKPLDMPVY